MNDLEMGLISLVPGTLCKINHHTTWVSGKREDYESVGWFMGIHGMNIMIKWAIQPPRESEKIFPTAIGQTYYYHYSTIDKLTPL